VENEADDEVTQSGNSVAPGGRLHTLLRRVVDVRPEEVRAMVTSFAFFFFLLSSYFVLRPIRDAVAAASGVAKLPWLFAGTLTVTLLLNPMFSGLVARFPVRRVIPISYHFFALNLAAFYVVLRFVSSAEGSTVDMWMGRALYVWTTVFALFNTSIFWCLMADVFKSEQAKRLFGFIGVGGTLGSIIGSAFTAALAPKIGAINMLLISAMLIELAVFTVVRFPLQGHGDPTSAARRGGDPDVIGGSVWAGFSAVVRSPYLLGICGFMVLFTIGSTFLYFEQADIVGRFYADRTSRTAVLARLELAAQVLTVTTQIFFTGRIIRWVGLGISLALVPLISVFGFGALGLMPTFYALSVFTVLRRAGNFSITNPAMEVLFTVVKREDKYKAKNIIETFVYRGGDQVGAWIYAGMAGIGLSLAGISFAAVPFALVWLVLGLWLGRKQAVLAEALTAPRPNRLSPLSPETGQPLPSPSRVPT
jgi:ATP:ADP antiporter, AAA family